MKQKIRTIFDELTTKELTEIEEAYKTSNLSWGRFVLSSVRRAKYWQRKVNRIIGQAR